MKKYLFLITMGVLFGLFTHQVWGQQQISLEPPDSWGSNLANLTLPAIIQAGVKLLFIVAAIISFVFLVIGGIKWILSGGDKEQMGKAQQTITSALIGLVIVVSAWAIIKLLEAFFNINILSNLKVPTVSK